jgi:hypothetical protein
MNTISRSDMLARIVAGGEIPFRIAFVKATGKEAGRLTEKVCYYGAPNPGRIGPSGVSDDRAPRRSHLEANTIPLTEFGSGRNCTPFISHILTYNGKQVIH